jgi:branched-chain amino acid transport system ATP-binding protein
MSADFVSAEGVSKRFGGLSALDGVSMAIRSGVVTGVIGPNGAGKTTLFNCLTGYVRPTRGTVHVEGANVTGRSPSAIARMGIARTFQIPRVFPSLSVLDNAMLGKRSSGEKIRNALFMRPRVRKSEELLRDRAREVLQIVGLEKNEKQLARELGYPERKLLEIARSLVMESRVILLDEPFSGLYGETIKKMMALVRELVEEHNIAVCLIEHNMYVIMNLADYLYVLDYGKLIAEGDCASVQSNECVVEAYLGRS